MFIRNLKIKLPPDKSAFLWGPRKTGKSTLVKSLFPGALTYDLLKSDVFHTFLKSPSQFREEVISAKQSGKSSSPIVVDEVQKLPDLLDEIHWLIENAGLNFVLCGSSARKLKRGHANLLGGRAWRFSLLPLSRNEIPDFDLLKAMNNGLIPSHYLEENAARSLKAYVQDYLKEEIFAEGLTRNIQAFSRFTETLGHCNGALIIFSNIAREVRVSANTVKEYFQILEDTLVGHLIYPFSSRQKRNTLTKTPKFYLFDVGVSGFLEKRKIQQEWGIEFGRAFEHFIFMELHAHRSYRELDYPISFWRTTHGQEVDFILGDCEAAIEVKGTSTVTNKETKNLRSFLDHYQAGKAIVVCNEKRPRISGNIEILPWRDFLDRLWDGNIIS